MSLLFLDTKKEIPAIVHCYLLCPPVLSVIFVLGNCFLPHFPLCSVQLSDTPSDYATTYMPAFLLAYLFTHLLFESSSSTLFWIIAPGLYSPPLSPQKQDY